MVTNTGQGANALAIYRRIVDPVSAIKVLGRSIALSGMMGCSSVEQGELLAMECLSSGTAPLSLKQRYHITKFGLMQQSSYTMSEFQRAGGKVKELSRTGDLAKAIVSLGDDAYEVSLSWAEAQQEPFPYEGKEKDTLAILAAKKKPPLKAKYATPMSRKQMLWWRLINDTIRSHWPEINGGIYAAEEVDEANADDEDGEVVEAEFQVVEQPENPPEVVEELRAEGGERKAEAGITDHPSLPEIGCTSEQSAKIRDLFASLNLTEEQVTGILKKRHASAIRNLTGPQADELIAALTKKLADVAGETPAAAKTEAAMTASHDGPATAEQAEEVKLLLRELEQTKPGTVAKFKAKLVEAGAAKITDLKWGSCERLIGVLTLKTMDEFFRLSLEKWLPPETESAAKN